MHYFEQSLTFYIEGSSEEVREVEQDGGQSQEDFGHFDFGIGGGGGKEGEQKGVNAAATATAATSEDFGGQH